MPDDLLPEQGQTASRRVTTHLVRRVINGDYHETGKLPTERELSESLHVSRHVVREALKRLETLGLIRIRQGSGAHVNDVSMSGGIELFEYLVRDEQGRLDMQVIRDYLVFYRHVTQEAVRMAAVNRTEEDMGHLDEALHERANALENLQELNRINRKLFQCLARATHNRFYQLIFNNLGRITVKLREAVPLGRMTLLVPQPVLETLLQAIRDQDGEKAAQIAGELTLQGENLLRAWDTVRETSTLEN